MYTVLGIVLAGLAVALGAFGAHGLRKVVSAENVAVYQTGVQYQMYHALALIAVGLLSEKFGSGFVGYAGAAFLAGVLLFSGSLYLIVSLYAMSKPVPRGVGILTPVGGLFFIFGWVCLLVGVLKN